MSNLLKSLVAEYKVGSGLTDGVKERLTEALHEAAKNGKQNLNVNWYVEAAGEKNIHSFASINDLEFLYDRALMIHYISGWGG